jgi:hypothetical protein
MTSAGGRLMKVIAIDPGLTCGIAGAELLDRGSAPQLYAAFQVSPFDAIEAVRVGKFDVVVCESFIPRPGARTWQPEALYTIGALSYVTTWQDTPFRLQSPADAKQFSTDEKLKRLGWYTPGRDHANDAGRHLLLAFIRMGMDPEVLSASA